ncbi:ABC transporter ATP-binding protein [Bacteroidia bacterium]|nr:ABC transporter ATP-binding protein [Bacteroidia bacterium]
MSQFHFTPQRDAMDCGPACLSMIASAHGKRYSVEYLREQSFLTKEGVSLLGITEAAQKIGFETLSAKLTVEKLKNCDIPLPCMLHWNQNHFVVLRKAPLNPPEGGKFGGAKIRKLFYNLAKANIPPFGGAWGGFRIADPAHGFISLSEENFRKSWLSDGEKGVALFLNPTEKFYETEPPVVQTRLIASLRQIFSYLKSYKWQLVFMFLLLLAGSALTLIFPFLTQNLIDKGVNGKNLHTVTVILLAQLALFFGAISFEIIRNWLMLFVGTRLSIRIISDFLKKLLKLPIKFFDTKMMGDFRQRIQDNERIEHFLTSQSLVTFFSMLTFSVFFGVLWYYDFTILLVYFVLTVVSILWSVFWLRKLKILDYFRFQERSANQESIYEILNDVTEMKLNDFADYKRRKWEEIQERLFKLNIRILRLDQLQMSGFEFINQLKNIVVTFLAATLVIKGSLSLGVMLAISYIIGQMNSPVNQLVGFFRGLQDARLSLERLNEVQNHPEEEIPAPPSPPEGGDVCGVQNTDAAGLPDSSPLLGGIGGANVSFQYEGPHSPFVLKNVKFAIPEGKITAIVGASGSGKTTLMKLLLKFYEPTEGEIYLAPPSPPDRGDVCGVQNTDVAGLPDSSPLSGGIGGANLRDISPAFLRSQIGVVMQDGFIFSDTIERNIATSDENIDREKLRKAVQTANVEEFIESLPLKYNTKIGAAGNGISGGQRQRILIARAVYKNPHYIFFDEATSALDAENEKIIHDNLQEFFKGKTVLIIAHRLSTVKNADNIIVMKEGKIVEQGTHAQLVGKKGEYFNLVKNQLELGE